MCRFGGGSIIFRPDVESPSEMSLVGLTKEQHGLNINNSPNSELSDNGGHRSAA